MPTTAEATAMECTNEEAFARLAALEAQDPYVARELEKFNSQLIEADLPELLTDKEATKMKHGPCVCLLSWWEEKRAMVEEGGKQAPRRVNLCVTPAWLERRANRTNDGVELYMHRGINMDDKGQARLMTFNPPQKVTYFANMITKGVNGVCDDGLDFELGRGRFADSLAGLPLVCPRSSSPMLEKLTNDKLHTRIVMTHARIAVPETVAFVYQKAHGYPPIEGTTIQVRYWESLDAVDWAAVEKDVTTFVERMKTKCERVVVKPSGPLWMGSVGVTFQPLDPEAVMNAVRDLAKRIHPGDSVLIDEFCKTLAPQDIFSQRELPLRAVLDPGVISETSRVKGAVRILKAEAEMARNRGAPKRFTVERSRHVGDLTSTRLEVLNGFRIRTVVQRTDAGPVVAKHVCAVGPSDEPLHGANTIPQTLEVTLQQWGVTGDKLEEVKDLIERDAQTCFNALSAYEARLSDTELGGPRAQTDCIGLDIILASRAGAIEPVVIEVNDHDCLFHSIAMEDMHPELRGECARPWTSHMLQRSQQFMRRDMTLVVVGGGGFSKAFLWPMFREKGFRIVLLDENPDHLAKDLVDVFIVAPEMSDHSRDLETADMLVKRLADAGFDASNISGCVTYWEDCSPLNARLCELLGKPGNTYEAHSMAKSKFMTHKHLAEHLHEKSHCLNVAVPSYKVTSVAELEAAMEKVALPFLLKTEHGSSSVGVIMVESKQEAIDQYKRLCTQLASDSDHSGSGLSFKGSGATMVVMSYIDGSEHNVDILMHEGKPLFCAISDFAPTKLPYFSEVASCMPSRLHPHRQKTLIYTAVHCLKGLGLLHGAFNVGLKYTTMGPRLIEINARMGGFYLRDWIQRIYGVDMALGAAMLACGVQPFLRPSEPLCFIAGVMMYSSVTASQMRAGGRETLRMLAEEEEIVLNEFEAEIPHEEEFEEPICNVACAGANFDEASKAVSKMLRALRLNAHGGIAAEWYLENI